MEQLVAIHDELLQTIATAHRVPYGELMTSFFPIRGSAATGELMVVGRAVNGWTSEWTAEDVAEPARRLEIVREVVAASTRPDCCPMSWVVDSWGKNRNQSYNTKRSAFWRVIRLISFAMCGPNENWPSTLIWSNLCKVSPAAGGNPSGRLLAAQEESCVRHLIAEIDLWQPRNILFITGWDWAKPFLERLGVVGEHQSGTVQWAGDANRPGNANLRVVVSARPERRAEIAFVEQVIKSFGRVPMNGLNHHVTSLSTCSFSSSLTALG